MEKVYTAFIVCIILIVVSNIDKTSIPYDDTEICVRYGAGDYTTCKNNKTYSKEFADIVRNGGCVAGMPDQGQMLYKWEVCKAVAQYVDLLYLPTGEAIKFHEGETVLRETPMSDEEYKLAKKGK